MSSFWFRVALHHLTPLFAGFSYPAQHAKEQKLQFLAFLTVEKRNLEKTNKNKSPNKPHNNNLSKHFPWAKAAGPNTLKLISTNETLLSSFPLVLSSPSSTAHLCSHGAGSHLHQKVPCPERFLQPLLIASKRGVHGLWPLFLCYKSRQQNCLWFGSFESADKKFKVLLAGCVVPLQPSQPGARTFHKSCQCLLGFPWQELWRKGSCSITTFRPHIHHCPPPFTRFCFLLDQAKDWERVVCCFWEFWLPVLALSLAEKLCSFHDKFGSFLAFGLSCLDFRKRIKEMRSKRAFCYLRAKIFPSYSVFPRCAGRCRCGCWRCFPSRMCVCRSI